MYIFIAPCANAVIRRLAKASYVGNAHFFMTRPMLRIVTVGLCRDVATYYGAGCFIRLQEGFTTAC